MLFFFLSLSLSLSSSFYIPLFFLHSTSLALSTYISCSLGVLFFSLSPYHFFLFFLLRNISLSLWHSLYLLLCRGLSFSISVLRSFYVSLSFLYLQLFLIRFLGLSISFFLQLIIYLFRSLDLQVSFSLFLLCNISCGLQVLILLSFIQFYLILSILTVNYFRCTQVCFWNYSIYSTRWLTLDSNTITSHNLLEFLTIHISYLISYQRSYHKPQNKP